MLLALALAATTALSSPGSPGGDTIPSAMRLRPTPASVSLTTMSTSSPSGVTLFDVRSGTRSPEEPTPQLIEYSDGYFTRLTIHKWASYLTVPLFVGQYVVGQKLIDGEGSSGMRSLHGAPAGGVAGLFAVNTVTGGMNLIEGWKDPAGKNRRVLHSVLMLLADAGFVATGMLANENEHEGGVSSSSNNDSHRNMAIASMGTALVSYAIMLPIFGHE